MKRTVIFIFFVALFWIGAGGDLNAQTFYWAGQFGGSSGYDGAQALVRDSAGNIYITGYYATAADVDPGSGTFNLTSAGGQDVFVVKLTPSGNLVWAKSFGGPLGDAPFAMSSDTSGNLYITGNFEGTADFDPGVGVFSLSSAGNFDIFVVKLDTAGNFIWAGKMGSNMRDDVTGIDVDLAGNAYVTGRFEGTADLDPGTPVLNFISAGWTDIFVVSIDKNGNLNWADQIGNTNGESALGIVCDNMGNTYSTGRFGGTVDFDPRIGVSNLTVQGSYGIDVYVLKLDPLGNFLWVKGFGGSDIVEAEAIALDHSGNILMTGYYDATCDFDPGTGTDNHTSLAGSFDVFISKLDPLGNFLWAKGLESNLNVEQGRCIGFDRYNNVYTTGYVEGTTDFDPGTGTFSLPAAGGIDIYIECLAPSGNFITAVRMGGPGYDQGAGMMVDDQGMVYVVGSFDQAVDFDPTTSIFNLVSTGLYDGFVTKMFLTNYNEASSIEEFAEGSLRVFPNPNAGKFSIEFSNEIATGKDASLKVYNEMGEIVFRSQVNGLSALVDIASQAAGIYFVQVTSENKIFSVKIVKQ